MIKQKLFWIGTRRSDIDCCGDFFYGSISIFGKSQKNNYTFESEYNIRPNHNEDIPKYIDFIQEKIFFIVSNDDTARFLFYYPVDAYYLDNTLLKYIIGLNDFSVLKLLEDKILIKSIVVEKVPLLPHITLSGRNLSFKILKKTFPEYDEFVLQEHFSCGGFGTRVFTRSMLEVKDSYDSDTTYSISPYIKNSIPINIHACIFENDILLLQPSIQIIQNKKDGLLYKGADFIACKQVSEYLHDLVRKYSTVMAEYLCSIGFRGVCGFDFIVTKDQVFFLEINPRSQSSSFLLSEALIRRNLPSLQQLHIESHKNFYCHFLKEEIENTFVNRSFFCFAYSDEKLKWLKYIHSRFRKYSDIMQLYDDDLDWQITLEQHAYLYKIIFDEKIIFFDSEILPRLQPNITPSTNILTDIKLKIMLLNRGISFSDSANVFFKNISPCDRSEFDAITMSIHNFNKMFITVPIENRLNFLSPFELDIKNNLPVLKYLGDVISEITVLPENPLDYKKTKSNINFSEIAYLGADRLRISYMQGCALKTQDGGCKFCDVPKSQINISTEDIFEIIDSFRWHKKIRHYLIGGGSSFNENIYEKINTIVLYLKKDGKPIYLMTMPPKNTSILKKLKQSGVDEIAFNIEIFDRNIAKQIMPLKSSLALSVYFDALNEAVTLWGMGNVYCALILGLEGEKTFFEGIEKICSLGVSPILSLLKPIKDTPLENHISLNDKMIEYFYNRINEICVKYMIPLGPRCKVCCNNVIKV